MAATMEQIREFMEGMGLPGREQHGLPDSARRFPDGAHYRIEIAGVERLSTLRAMLAEAKRCGVVVHRAIATVGGSTFCQLSELKEMARVAREEQVEVIITTGYRKAWDPGSKEMSNPEGAMQGFRLRGADGLAHWLADLMRNVEAGFRGFLVYDEGALMIADRMRQEGLLPPETIFKLSVFAGYCNPAGALVARSLGADTMNPISDVSLAILASIRRAVDMPLDVYLMIVDSFGGMFRAYEGPEIARVAAPCYFKIEPGASEGEIYKPWVSESWHQDFVREKVKMAAIVQELMQRHAPGLESSPAGAADLALPAA